MSGLEPAFAGTRTVMLIIVVYYYMPVEIYTPSFFYVQVHLTVIIRLKIRLLMTVRQGIAIKSKSRCAHSHVPESCLFLINNRYYNTGITQ